MRIMIIEDHAAMRDVLSTLVDGQSEHQVVGAVASAEELLENLEGVAFDLALVDLSLPGMSGAQLVVRLLEAQPGVRVLIVSGHSAKLYGKAAVRVGAHGYVMKDEPEEILEAIRIVAEGGTYAAGDGGV